MEKVRVYRVDIVVRKNHESQKDFLTMDIFVPKGEDIMKYIDDNIEQETYYKIKKIREILKCPGCRNESPGQLPHTEHPYGCLHVIDTCELCGMEQ